MATPLRQAHATPHVAERLLLPLLLINVPVSENGWALFGVPLGQMLVWAVIAVATAIVWRSPYRTQGMTALAVGMALRVIEVVTQLTTVIVLRRLAIAVLLLICGATVFGRVPSLFRRQLVWFLALCVPVMLLQISGAHPAFLSWGTDAAHDEMILGLHEIGTFKMLPVFPTLFVPEDVVTYTIYQGRPTGLLHANNLLSVFVVIAFGMNLGMATHQRLRLADIIICVSLVLTMSLTASVSFLLLVFAVLALGPRWRRLHAIKLLAVVGLTEALYAWLFPGLFATHFSEGKLLGSIFTRGVPLLDRLGLSFLRDFMYARGAESWFVLQDDTTYSGIEQIVASPIVWAVVAVAPVLLLVYCMRLRSLAGHHTALAVASVTTACACVLTQFAVPYFVNPSFQVLFGVALLPMFPRLWPRVSAVPCTIERDHS